MVQTPPMPSVFKKVPPELDFPKEEREVLAFWEKERIFERSLAQPGPRGTFVFYEGPPTANGLPHNGHVLTRVIKDLFPRYKTMCGYHVPRKAGWDTHGLPVEVEVEKELRIHGKAAIEAYGIEPFVKRCIESVFRYTHEWEELTERVGFWVDLKKAYVTYHRSYVESVWWALSELFKKGLLYQGHKVVWWWAQGGTALSSGEVGLGYKQVDDPSVYVAFPLVDEPGTSLLVWTTTPWTLPSNAYVAVQADFDYVVVADGERRLIIAKDLVDPLAKKLKCPLSVVHEMKGRELVGKRYLPPFDLYYASMKDAVVGHKDGTFGMPYWQVIDASFVTLDTGTGIVHVAPAFGEDDFQAHRAVLAQLSNPAAVPLLCAVRPDGTFGAELSRYSGRWVKDCDKDITHELKERDLLVHAETYRHDYPFCWRADSDPLIQYARPAWYIKTTAVIDQAISNNRAVEWLPEHIKEGRFGDFLAHNVDWALSRERFWGTPLNLWINDKTGKMEAPASVAEILAKNTNAFEYFEASRKADPTLSEHLSVHKPWIDHVTWQNPGEEGTYRRVPEVIDCWFDSGCMPFAQWGFPHAGREEFGHAFPADFISEAIDQTRGWFYSLLMISTLVFDEACQKRLDLEPPRPFPHPYKTCIVLGHVSDKEGKKESKSKGNYTPPDVILDEVKMDFAVVDWEKAKEHVPKKVQPDGRHAYVAPEDFEGMDLVEGAEVKIFAGGRRTEAASVPLQSMRGLPRRVVILPEAIRSSLGVTFTSTGEVKPVEVPFLPAVERVTILDPLTPSPGADAFRWFFYASNPPWNATRHSLSNVRSLQKDFLVKLRNVYSFFTIYANIDGEAPPGQVLVPSELDRWILSELALTTRAVTEKLDAYDVYGATQALTEFVEALSNWYVRRSRDRFWRSGWDEDKGGAHSTLYGVLCEMSKLIAPFVPFFAETLYQNLVVGLAKPKGVEVPASVHLERFPEADERRINLALSKRMRAVRDIVSVGLQVRTNHKLKVRQPLRSAHVVLNEGALLGALQESAEMIREELNVLGVEFVTREEAAKFGQYSFKPNFRSLGQRGLGKQAQELKKAWASLDEQGRAKLEAIVVEGSGEYASVRLVREDIEAFFETKPGFAAAGDRVGVVVLETALDDELRDMGLAREIQNRIQGIRKEMGLEYTDRIVVGVLGSPRVMSVVQRDAVRLSAEVLATRVQTEELPIGKTWTVDIEGEDVQIGVARALDPR
jgi:isoleucyl-tRNA synthetase